MRASLEGEELSFVRNPRSRGGVMGRPNGLVHVERPDDSDPEPLRDAQARAEAWADYIISGGPKAATLCGKTLVLGSETGTKPRRVGSFLDEDLCAGCLRAMGEESYLAFGFGGGRDDDE